MIRQRFSAFLLACAASCLAFSAQAQGAAVTSSGSGESAQTQAPAPRKAATAKKPVAKKAKSEGLTLPKSISERGATETRPMQRRIDPDDIADPYGGVGGGSGNRVSPMMTPSGRAGLGGRF